MTIHEVVTDPVGVGNVVPSVVPRAETMPPDPRRCRVVVVEPDPGVRRLLGDRIPGADRVATLADLDVPSDRPVVAVLGPGGAGPGSLAELAVLTADRPLLAPVVVLEELTTEGMQAALRSGARDVVAFDTPPEVVVATVGRVADLVVQAGGPQASHGPDTGVVRGAPGRVVAVFSPRGGVGKTVVATNVAAALAARSDTLVALVDADLEYGDVAVSLGLPPEHSVVDAVGPGCADDPGVVRDLLVRDRSGVLVLPAPREPMLGVALSPDDVHDVCGSLRRIAGTTVVDVPSVFDDATFALLDTADEVLLVASLDIPSIKNLKVGMQAYDLVGLVGPKLRLVLNRANARVKLDPREIERVLGIPVSFTIPYDLAVPISVNAGQPVVRHAPRSAAARAFDLVAGSLGGVGPSTDRPWPRRRSARRGD